MRHASSRELDDAALDQLPFGVVHLDPTGTVTRYNQTEAARARTQRWRALGRNYVRDLAGTNGRELAAQIAALPRGACVRIEHAFQHYGRRDAVVIDMSRDERDRVYLCIRKPSA